MKPAISQVCSLPSPFATDLCDYASGNWQNIELWLTKLEIYLESNSLKAVQELAEQYKLTFPVASFQGGLLSGPGAASDTAWESLASRLELCQQLQIDTLVPQCRQIRQMLGPFFRGYPICFQLTPFKVFTARGNIQRAQLNRIR